MTLVEQDINPSYAIVDVSLDELVVGMLYPPRSTRYLLLYKDAVLIHRYPPTDLLHESHYMYSELARGSELSGLGS